MHERWLSEAKSGNCEAVNSLLRTTDAHVRNVAKRFLPGKKHRQDVEDVLQETLMAIHRDLQKCRAKSWGEYLGWVAVITRNRCYAFLQKSMAAQRDVRKTVAITSWDDLTTRGDVEASAIAKETLGLLNRIAWSHAEDAETLAMRIDGCSCDQIAEATNRDRRDVYKSVRRIKRTLEATLA